MAQGERRDGRIDGYLTAEVGEHEIPGLATAVLRDGAIVHLAGYGQANLECGVPVTEETVYELASVTKPFTATAIMLLVEDGKVCLNDGLDRFFPEAPLSWDGITIRHLLNHSSGIPDYFNLEAFQLGEDFAWRLDFSPEAFLEIVRDAALDFPPGSQTGYSNTGYNLLGMLIERVTDRSYEEFLAERVFAPLGMTATRRNSRTEIIPCRAAGYVSDEGILQNAPYTSMTWAYAEGGIVSSARDMARWDAALTAGELLSHDRLEEMWNPPGEELPAIGLGWTRNTSPVGITIGHSGGKPGFATYHARFPDNGISVILLANRNAVPIIDIGRGLAQQCARAA